MKRLKLVLIVCFFISSWVEAQEAQFRVNLAGYPAEGSKSALLLSIEKLQNTEVFLVNESTGLSVNVKARMAPNTPWKPFAFCLEIDFSETNKSDNYHLFYKAKQLKSASFKVGDYPNWQEDLVRFMQTQRCGFNPFLNVECHQKDGLSFYGKIPDSTFVEASGGWHDAGDQLKYLITGSNATARMLMAYEENPEAYGDEKLANGLPGKNGIPDVLDEAIWGLDWIFKLHPEPEVLYHQVADDRDHHGFKLPQNDNADYGWGVNDYRPVYAATGSPQGLGKYKSRATGFANVAGRSAAAMALAYKVLKAFPEKGEYAEKCLEAAKELYNLGLENVGYQQGNSYGAPYRYEENTWEDDMEWAAAELFRVTGKKKFLKEARFFAKEINIWSWMERDSASHYEMYPFVNMGHYALWQAGKKKDKKLASELYAHNLNTILKRAVKNEYGVGHLFIWCSNHLASAVATQALLYEKMTGEKTFNTLMQDHINWLFGLNPWGSSMITGIPEKADFPVDVHMPFAQLLDAKIKGSLVDGPISAVIYDNMLGITLSKPDPYADLQPDHIRYHDDYADYSSNEPTMDGTADLIMLLAFLNKPH